MTLHDVGNFKKDEKVDILKERSSFTLQLHYGVILHNIYCDSLLLSECWFETSVAKNIINLWWNPFGVKTKDIDDITSIPLRLIKVLPKQITETHGIVVIGNKDICLPPLLLRIFILHYHIKILVKVQLFL